MSLSSEEKISGSDEGFSRYGTPKSKICFGSEYFFLGGGELNLPHGRVGYTTELRCVYSVSLFVNPSIFREFLKNVKN